MSSAHIAWQISSIFIAVDFCFREECSDHGDCESRPDHNDHVCHCYEGWMGADCSMQRCTIDVTCMNSGVCGCVLGTSSADVVSKSC